MAVYNIMSFVIDRGMHYIFFLAVFIFFSFIYHSVCFHFSICYATILVVSGFCPREE